MGKVLGFGQASSAFAQVVGPITLGILYGRDPGNLLLFAATLLSHFSAVGVT